LDVRLFTAGDFQVTLYGVVPPGGFEEVGDYAFRIVRR
jgi:hypothetical protein